MPVNARCYRVDNLIHNVGVARQLANGLLILFCHSESSQLVVRLDHIVGFENCSKYREAVAVIELSIVVVAVDASDFDLLTRLCPVNKIP